MKDLTNREKEILCLIIDEKSSAEIAEKLKISVKTVNSHRLSIGQKIGSTSLVAFTKYAIERNWLEGYYAT